MVSCPLPWEIMASLSLYNTAFSYATNKTKAAISNCNDNVIASAVDSYHSGPKLLSTRKILPLCLPPHSTHLLQPLDVAIAYIEASYI